MSSSRVPGLHHVTCVSGSAQETFRFYANVLGLRLVKTTVHMDDVDVYHLYFGDDEGSPGTVLTFFPFPSADPGIHGTGSATNTTFAVPEHAQSFWAERLSDRLVSSGWEDLLGEPVLRFRDDEGQELRLAVAEATELRAATTDIVPPEHGICYIKGIDFVVRDPEPTHGLLTGGLGLEAAAESGDRSRLRFGDDRSGCFVDVVARPDLPAARPVPLEGLLPEAGTVNHVAFGPIDEDHQLRLRESLQASGYEVSKLKDRRYFTSIYFLDQSGIRLEIATGQPGFAVDEDPEHLGQELMLPPWLEHRRAEYEASLPPLDRTLLTTQ